jgi:hypothetical protein
MGAIARYGLAPRVPNGNDSRVLRCEDMLLSIEMAGVPPSTVIGGTRDQLLPQRATSPAMRATPDRQPVADVGISLRVHPAGSQPQRTGIRVSPLLRVGHLPRQHQPVDPRAF